MCGVVSGGLVSDAYGASGRRSRRDCGAPRGGGPVPPVGLLEVFQAAEAAAVRLEPQARVSSLLRAPTQPEASGETTRTATEAPTLGRSGAPNQVWSADFMSDALYEGTRFRTFNVIDDFNRESLAVEIDTSLTGRRLIRIFEQLRLERGFPQRLRVDNGPEFLSAAFVAWADSAGLVIQYIPKGEPNQNAYIERFNRTYREEVLNLYLFRNLAEVRETTHWW